MLSGRISQLKRGLHKQLKVISYLISSTSFGSNRLPIEAARLASQKNLSLSEDKLQEYNRLRSVANTRAVDERQSLNALERDEKTSSRALSSLQEAFDELKEKESKLVSEIDDLKEKKQEVEIILSFDWVFI